MAAAISAREDARRGRVAQLDILSQFEAGKPVTFKVHNNPAGFKLSKTQIKPATKKNGPRVGFDKSIIFLDAAINGIVDEVNDGASKGADVHAVDADGMTALHRACIENYLNVVSSLLAKDADVSKQDNDWWTPLHAAAQGGHWRICNQLLNNGADPLAVNAEGDLPIDLVGDQRTEGIIQREMESRGVDVSDDDAVQNVRNQQRTKMMDDMKEAVKNGVNLNKQYESGATWLHVAACNGYIDVLQYLLEQPSINPNIGDDEGNTPLHLAVFFQQYECVMYLVAKGADLKTRNHLDQKPIILAEDQTMIRLLTALEKKTGGADKIDKSKKKYTGSISRSTRANKGRQSMKDKAEEGKLNFSELSIE
eukprot:m.334435 g.334435  ORF g.334435 m.334435 type:complete len:366 (+) comp17354_c0_seq1:197-1294(+)